MYSGFEVIMIFSRSALLSWNGHQCITISIKFKRFYLTLYISPDTCSVVYSYPWTIYSLYIVNIHQHLLSDFDTPWSTKDLALSPTTSLYPIPINIKLLCEPDSCDLTVLNIVLVHYQYDKFRLITY